MCWCGREAVVKVNNACDEAADISRRQTRHGGKFSFRHGRSMSETLSLVNIARQIVKGGNETGLLSQVDDVYRSRKKILQVDGSPASFLYHIQEECDGFPRVWNFSLN